MFVVVCDVQSLIIPGRPKMNNKSITISKNQLVVRNKQNLKTKKKPLASNQMVVLSKNIPITKSFTVSKKPLKVNGKTSAKGAVVTVKHCELIDDINTPTSYNGGFILNKFSVNPGLKDSFPWLYKMALNFESYQFKDIKYYFKPTLSTLYSGNIYMAAQYDIDAGDPEGKVDMMQIQGSKEGPLYQPFNFALAKGKGGISNQKTYKVRAGNITGELELYDSANFFVAFNAVFNSSTGTYPSSLYIGELWCEYELEFVIPVGKTSRVQLANIESLSWRGSTTGTSSAMVYGTGVKNFIGKLASAGLKYFESKVGNGYYLSTAKTCTKMLSTLLTYTAGTPAVPKLSLISYRNDKSSYLDDSTYGKSDNDEFGDPVTVYNLYEAGTLDNLNVQLPVSNTTAATLPSGTPFVTTKEYVISGTQALSRHFVRMKPETILLIEGQGTGTIQAGYTWLDFTDYDISDHAVLGFSTVGEQQS